LTASFSEDVFGASGPYLNLYEHRGLAPRILAKLNGEQA
jgi:hypothetical protein